jgi:cell division septum initiation protein DivIVA
LSRHNISTSCDELLAIPCCSNNEASTSSSTCNTTNLVEEIKELKDQVTSLEKDLEKRHEGKSTLDNILSVKKSPNDKSGLGFNSNNKNKSKSNKNKNVQDLVKNLAKIICFKCKIEGHHVRSCPLKNKHLSEKQQGKRPQGQAQARPQVEDRPLTKNKQDEASQIKKSTKKRKGSTCCYICRDKGDTSQMYL